MPVSVIVGGQYGSEGKGKVAYYWAKKVNAAAVVRVGGSNSGHTVYDKAGRKFALRMLPTASIDGDVTAVLPAGSYVDIEVLLQEMKMTALSHNLLKIDNNAVIITEEYKSGEAKFMLRQKVGSTLSGTGLAVMNRVMRVDNVLLAKDVPELTEYLCDTKQYMRSLLDERKNIVIEGTQGYGLSNYHANY